MKFLPGKSKNFMFRWSMTTVIFSVGSKPFPGDHSIDIRNRKNSAQAIFCDFSSSWHPNPALFDRYGYRWPEDFDEAENIGEARFQAIEDLSNGLSFCFIILLLGTIMVTFFGRCSIALVLKHMPWNRGREVRLN